MGFELGFMCGLGGIIAGIALTYYAAQRSLFIRRLLCEGVKPPSPRECVEKAVVSSQTGLGGSVNDGVNGQGSSVPQGEGRAEGDARPSDGGTVSDTVHGPR